MAPKAGSLGYLHLSSSFGEPRWRQAVIIKVQDGWLKTLVKCSQEEITESGLTPVTSGSNVFCLVEAEVHQLRLGVHGVTMELGHDAKELRNLATSVLESDEDLNWATASEPGKEKKEKKEKRRTSRKDDDDSGSSVTSEEDDLLGELKKSWLGNGSKRRQEQKRVKQRCRTEKEVQAFLPDRSQATERQGAVCKRQDAVSGPSGGSPVVRSATWSSCPSPCRILEGKAETPASKVFKAKQPQPILVDKQLQQRLIPGQSGKGACSSRAELSEGRKEKVQRTDQTCPSVRERHRGRIRSRRQALQDHGLQQAHPLWQTAELEAMPFFWCQRSSSTFSRNNQRRQPFRLLCHSRRCIRRHSTAPGTSHGS